MTADNSTSDGDTASNSYDIFSALLNSYGPFKPLAIVVLVGAPVAGFVWNWMIHEDFMGRIFMGFVALAVPFWAAFMVLAVLAGIFWLLFQGGAREVWQEFLQREPKEKCEMTLMSGGIILFGLFFVVICGLVYRGQLGRVENAKAEDDKVSLAYALNGLYAAAFAFCVGAFFVIFGFSFFLLETAASLYHFLRKMFERSEHSRELC